MIRITVDLVSAIHPSRSRRLGVMHIINDGTGSKTRCDYMASLVDKRGRAYRTAKVHGHPRLAVSMWQLVAKALRGLVDIDVLVTDKGDDSIIHVFSGETVK